MTTRETVHELIVDYRWTRNLSKLEDGICKLIALEREDSARELTDDDLDAMCKENIKKLMEMGR